MEAPLRTRPIRLKDLDRIMEIERASFGADAYDRALFLDYRAGGALFLAADRGGRILGYALAEVRGRRAELVSIAVDPPDRGRGAASALIESLLRRLRRRGVFCISLMVKAENGDAQALYRKYGFRRARRVRRYYEDGADGWLMTLERPDGRESGAPAPIALP
jgi:ribosomal-protein-alanine N-acetyltransferase